MRALRFTLALVLAIVAGVAGASAVVGSTPKTADVSPADVEPDGSGAVLAATAPDPAAGPAWAVRVYRSQAGSSCPEANRTEDGDFGRVDGDGSFHPLPLGPSGNCIDLTRDAYAVDVSHFPADDERGARAVIYGVVTSQVRSVAVTVDQTRHDLDIAHGAYVLAIEDADAGNTHVDVTLADGTIETHPLRPSTLDADGARP